MPILFRSDPLIRIGRNFFNNKIPDVPAHAPFVSPPWRENAATPSGISGALQQTFAQECGAMNYSATTFPERFLQRMLYQQWGSRE
jgi:hypothetical protein